MVIIMAKRKKKDPYYSTDDAARNIMLHLLRDFRASEGGLFCRQAETAFLTGIQEFREYEFPELGVLPVGRFKRYKQMQALLKKYRFAKDAYSDEELQQKTLRKYFVEQERLARYTPMPEIGHMVAQRARKIAREILGSYSQEDAVVLCKFGKKSSIGCPLSLAYIDEKLSNANAFTGSSKCSRWFWGSVLPDDQILTEMVDDLQITPVDKMLQHESLNLVTVPKSWKTYRTITPLTLLSLFYSNGVGQLVTDRLQKAGLDIRRLQSRHRNLVKRLSMSTTHATADLSAASDSITIESLNRILPREWYRAIRRCLTTQVAFTGGDTKVHGAHTESVLPMGNGLTFPVETLIFYCIIKAIGELAGIDGIYSVYGDDLIYPSRLHKYVVGIFPYFKLVLNLDKTFVKYPFRESCGADFYRGCDVRPFYLQGECEQLSRTKYQAFLYKTINGLVRRWHPEEIRQTLVYLYTELAVISKEIFRVPPEYPDTAGIKTSEPWVIPLDLGLLPWSPVWLSFEDSYGNYRFKFRYLAEKPGRRFVKTVKPYYWLALQGLDDEPTECYSSRKSLTQPEALRSSLTWERHVRKRSYVRDGKRKFKRIVNYTPTVASRTSMQHSIRNGFTHLWI
jgi:hypothetical protein